MIIKITFTQANTAAELHQKLRRLDEIYM